MTCALWLMGVDAYPSPEPTVSTSWTQQTLAEAIPDLGGKAGEKLGAGPNVRDRRFFLFVNDLPLGRVKEELKEFVPAKPGKCLWYKAGSTSVFDEDLASRNARREAAKRRTREGERQRRAAFAAVRKWSKPRDDDTQLLRTAKVQVRMFQDVFLGMPNGARQAAFEGKRTPVPFANLTPEGQQHVWELVRGYGSSSDEGPSFIGSRDFRAVVVRCNAKGDPSDPGMEVLLDGSAGSVSLYDILHAPEYGLRTGWTWDKRIRSYINSSRRPEGLEKHPDLQRPITLTGGRYGYRTAFIEQVFQELSQKSFLPVVGEYDPCFVLREAGKPDRPGRRQQLEENQVDKLPVWQAMDIVCRRFDLTWDYQDRWLTIRSPRTVPSWAGEVDLSPPHYDQ